MEILLIFCVGWVMSHAFGEKRDEYEHAQDAHREKYMKRLAEKHPSWSKTRQARYLQNASRRNALGHLAYLLRHGWSSTFNDFAHGWDKAKAAHEEWKAEHPKGDKKPGWWATFKAGWNDKSRRREEAAVEREKQAPRVPDPAPTPKPEKVQRCEWCGSEISEGNVREVVLHGLPCTVCPACYKPHDPRQQTDKEASDAKVYPWPSNDQTSGNTAGSTNGSTTVEYNLDASKAAINEIGAYGASKVSVIEQIIADAIAGDMNADPEAMSHLASLQEALSNLTAHANAYVDSLNKHASGQEYANTGHAAKTDYLKSS